MATFYLCTGYDELTKNGLKTSLKMAKYQYYSSIVLVKIQSKVAPYIQIESVAFATFLRGKLSDSHLNDKTIRMLHSGQLKFLWFHSKCFKLLELFHFAKNSNFK